MLEINDLTFRFGARLLFEEANAFIAEGWKVGLIGRNGTGKSTLLKLIEEETRKPGGQIKLKRGARMGFVAQEVASGDQLLIDAVLATDTERAALMAELDDPAIEPERIGDIHMRLADIDAYSAEARAAAILTGLGFSQEDLTRPTSSFSGGWRMRAALGGVLVSAPDLLILDEPTNYLDLEGAAWLETHLKKYPNTVIVVSHDREMLNRSVTHVLALVDRKLEVHPGGYDTWLARRAEQAANAASQKAKQDKEREHLQSFIDRFKAKASKARQAQSRVKMLERMQTITVPLADRTTPFHFTEPEKLAAPLAELEDADLGYIKGRPVLKGVTFRLDPDDRIVIVGPNGQGKTTLVKSIAARLSLLDGERRTGRGVKMGYFSQDQLDELHPNETPLDHVKKLNPGLAEPRQRSIAAQMGFGMDKIETPAGKLSGGEKVRLLLGLLAAEKPHVLILDEPTSHLDIDSREALIHALNAFSGAVLMITHDVYLAEATADRLWLVNGGRARAYDGDLNDYRSLVLANDRPKEAMQAEAKRKGEAAPKVEATSAPAKVVDRKEMARRREALAPVRKRITDAEAVIAAADADLVRIDRDLADPKTSSGRLAELSIDRARVAGRREQAEEDWLVASEEYELALAS
jgi:ATP-binding cassette, subfamily F, member 3